MLEYMKASNWIWNPDWSAEDKDAPRVMLFRKKIELEEAPCEGRLNLSADTRYKLYVNAKLVEVGPSRGDYQVWFYDTVDILPYLQKGRNIIGVSVLRYPEDPAVGNHGMFGNPVTFGWRSIPYDDSCWQQAKPYIKKLVPQAVSPGNLKPRNIPYMYRKKRSFQNMMDWKESDHTQEEWEAFLNGEKELAIPAHTKVTVELDAGEEMTGYIRAAFSGGEGAVVSFLYAEAYVQEGVVGPEQIPVKADRMDKEKGHLQGYEDRYYVAGVGTRQEPETYEPYWFRTFRFVRLHIETAGEELGLQGLDYEETGYPLKVAASVRTSDSTLSSIWEISERTLKRCMHETYEDCPFYEQLQYIMDARTQILYTYAVSADDRLARKCMDDLRRSQRYDGVLNCSYPNIQ